MQRDAEAHAAEDKQRRELAEARNTAEQRVYQLEKLLEENKDKLTESDTAAVQRGHRQGQRGEEGRRRPARSTGRSTSSSGPARRWPSTSTPPASPAAPDPAPAPARCPARVPDPAAVARRRPDGAGGKPEDVIDVEFEEKK